LHGDALTGASIMGENPDAPDALLEVARDATLQGTWDTALESYEGALRGLVRSGDVERATAALRSIGQLHFERGALEEARDVLGASLAIAEVNRLPEPTAAALNGLAIIEQFAGRADSARTLYERAWTIAGDLSNLQLLASIEQNLGTLANIQGDLTTAKRHYLMAFGRFQMLGDDLSAARLLNNLGMTQVDAGEWDEAEASFDRAFALADALRHLPTLGNIETNRGDLCLQRGQLVRAREHCDRAFEIFARLDSKTGLGEAHRLYGALHRESSKLYLAEMHLLLAVEMARSSQDRLLEAEAERERALVAIAQGQDREALTCLNRARSLFEELQASRELLDIDHKLDGLVAEYLKIVTRWGESIEVADRYTAGHCRRVAELSMRLGAAAGLDSRALTTLRVAALLHDLGKLTIPPDVLNKTGPLTPREWEMIREHPVTGDRMIADKGLPWDVRPLVRGHHEHWDGSGYPDRLTGTQIPFGARILRIADSFDALTSARSYRPALSHEEALRVMEHEAGRVLDPDLYRLFQKTLADE
jgi:HD-GYP domain-containing protein (c-di-GMP phosphodiesterase class II)/Flp pilus assembly protein TadD